MIRYLVGLAVILLAACDARATKLIEIELPVDTVPGTVDTVTDTVEVFLPGDTVYDTTLVTDTLPGTVDTLTLEAVPDTIEIPVEGFILDYANTIANLVPVVLTRSATVWVLIELSGNGQKDEAWQLQASGEPVGQGACPVVPDHPWLGTGWVHVGDLEAGAWNLRAVHAIEVECYPPVASFATANSVHFKAIRLVTTRLEEQ